MTADGHYAAVFNREGVLLIDAHTELPVASLAADGSESFNATALRGNDGLVVIGTDKRLIEWDGVKETVRTIAVGGTSEAVGLSMSPDHAHLVIAKVDSIAVVSIDTLTTTASCQLSPTIISSSSRSAFHVPKLLGSSAAAVRAALATTASGVPLLFNGSALEITPQSTAPLWTDTSSLSAAVLHASGSMTHGLVTLSARALVACNGKKDLHVYNLLAPHDAAFVCKMNGVVEAPLRVALASGDAFRVVVGDASGRVIIAVPWEQRNLHNTP